MPLRAGRPEAAAVSWRWSATEVERRDSRSAAGAMRRRGLLQGLVGVAFGGTLLAFGLRGLGTTVLVLTSLITLAALLSPTGLYATLHRLFLWTGQVVGRALAWVVLVPLFYLFFYPFGVLLRRGRRDRLKRFFEPAAASYWEPHEGATASSTSRERQY